MVQIDGLIVRLFDCWIALRLANNQTIKPSNHLTIPGL